MVQRQSQNVSLAHRPNPGRAVAGSNLRVELAVETHGPTPFAFAPYLDRVKAKLDHRCLFEDEPEFFANPSNLPAVTRFIARDIFQQPVADGNWSSLTVWELDRFACTMTPGSLDIRHTIQHRNLILSVDGEADRVPVIRHIDCVFAASAGVRRENEFIWGEWLFAELARGIPGLGEVVVDLGRQRSLHLAGPISPLR